MEIPHIQIQFSLRNYWATLANKSCKKNELMAGCLCLHKYWWLQISVYKEQKGATLNTKQETSKDISII